MTRRTGTALATLLGFVLAVLALRPFAEMFADTTWVSLAVWAGGSICVLGYLGRRFTNGRALIVVTQVIVGVYALLFGFLADTLAYQLPTPTTVDRGARLLGEASTAINSFGPPVPASDGIAFMLVLISLALIIAVDAIGVTYRAPAAAGLPVLAIFVLPATVAIEALSPVHFVLTALPWLALMMVMRVYDLHRWSSAVAGTAGHSDEALPVVVRMGRPTRWAAAAAVALALVVTAVIPGAARPDRFGPDAGGGGTGGVASVGLNSIADISRSLVRNDQSLAFHYRTNSSVPANFRVHVLTNYTSGVWTMNPDDTGGLAGAPEDSLLNGNAVAKVDVFDNVVNPPTLPTPVPVVSVAIPSRYTWSQEPGTLGIRVNQTIPAYSIDYRVAVYDRTRLNRSKATTRTGRATQVSIPALTRQALDAEFAGVLNDRMTPWEKAVAIQAHLRDSRRFTYSLTLGKQPPGRSLDDLELFLETRQGYCVQYATTMVLAARSAGIPARLAIGYLPGKDETGRWSVRQSDAHAWPELYFEGFGWVPFEPTPAARTGTAPSYTVASDPAATSTSTAPTTTARPSTSVAPVTSSAAAPESGNPLSWLTSVPLVLLGVGLLLLLLMPLTGLWLARRRDHASHDAAEHAVSDWMRFSGRMRDLDLAPPESTGLQASAEHYVKLVEFPPEEAERFRGAVLTVERSLYATEQDTDELARVRPQLRDAERALVRHAGRGSRVRSRLFPSDAVSLWRDRLRRINPLTGANGATPAHLEDLDPSTESRDPANRD